MISVLPMSDVLQKMMALEYIRDGRADLPPRRRDEMNDTQDRLERLRGILYEPPDEAGWRRLSGLFEAWPADDPSLLVGVDYAGERLATWPDALRIAPLSLGFDLVLYKRNASASSWVTWRFAGLKDPPHEAWCLGRVLDLTPLVGGMNAAELHDLAGWPHLARITIIRAPRVFGGGLGVDGDACAVALARSSWMLGLTHLELAHNGIGPRGASFLVGAERPALTHLDLDHNPLSNMGATFLGASPHLGGLVELGLSDNGIGDPGARALARSPALLGVRSLRFDTNMLTDEGLKALVGSPLFRGLASLDLSRNRLTATGAQRLASHPEAASLRTLDLSDNGLGPEGAIALSESGALEGLRSLSLFGCGIESRGAQAIAASALLGQITHLDLSSNHIGPEGAAALAASPRVANLQSLDLSDNLIEDTGRRALANSPHLSAPLRLAFAMA